MAETVELDFDELQDMQTVFEAAYLWAERNEIPSWNQWVSLISKLRRRYPDDPQFAGVQGRSAIASVSHQLLREIMDDVHGPGWELARRPGAHHPRRPPRERGSSRVGGPSGSLASAAVARNALAEAEAEAEEAEGDE